MYLLVTILKQTQPLSDIMAGFAKIGITGSTVLKGTGMGRVLMQTRVSLLSSDHINKVITDLESANNIVLTVIKGKDTLDSAIEIVKSSCGDLCEPGKGILFALPLEVVEGFQQVD
jgi:nitrogen regulatory protein PII